MTKLNMAAETTIPVPAPKDSELPKVNNDQNTPAKPAVAPDTVVAPQK